MVQESQLPDKLDTLFSFSMNSSSDTVKITDSLKVKFVITKNPDFIYQNKITYKLYYVTNDNQKHLLDIGKKLVKKSLTLSQTLQFSPKILNYYPFLPRLMNANEVNKIIDENIPG